VTALGIAACLFLASIAIGTAAGSVVVAGVERLARGRAWSRLGVRTRTGLLAQARLAPLTLGATLAVLVQLAFWRFEPLGRTETTGWVLPLLALAGATMVGTTLIRGWRSARATHVVARTWRRSGLRLSVPGWPGSAWAVRTPFPVVAVVGVRRAELFVSEDVIDACDPTELQAVAAHERAHVLAHDNLMRLLMAVSPAVGPAASRVEHLWEASAEEFADLQARSEGNAVTLARALTKVARLAADAANVEPLPMSAFIGRGGLEARVRRLLTPARAQGRSTRLLTVACAAGIAGAGMLVGLRAMYDAAEAIVHLGR
jgi:Zn-dependent protease with chaperone function